MSDLQFIETDVRGFSHYRVGAWEVSVHKDKLTDKKIAVASNKSLEADALSLWAECCNGKVIICLRSKSEFNEYVTLQKAQPASDDPTDMFISTTTNQFNIKYRFDNGVVDKQTLTINNSNKKEAHFHYNETFTREIAKHIFLVVGVILDQKSSDILVEEFSLAGTRFILNELPKLEQ